MSTALAYAAGLFDGEGCTYVMHGKRERDRPTLVLSITQCFDAEVLHRFVDAVGEGYVSGPVNESGTGSGPRWNYRCQRIGPSLVVLDRLWPWLGTVKRAQALAAASRVLEAVDLAWRRPEKREQYGTLLRYFLTTHTITREDT